jgi:para-nitrobenzyl esterase
MIELRTRFAKTGDPNGGINVTWPDYTRAPGRYLIITTTSSVMTSSRDLTFF